MATNIRIGLDHYGTQLQKNPNFDFNRKHLRDEEKRSRSGAEKDAKQESFREVLARVNGKRS